ncbi:hypothetical protein NEMBOFW57_002529 [Staphylotrichum longicolle]|uniref:Uncharacterized protein n=1 Tax=Staphylotrichum longicolle TaxID=669026 RepID=A0AAD4F489_9PEZI|nr:hypothetical protein NEMBOFW57_002529 [Staphylotrichum longicolle]
MELDDSKYKVYIYNLDDELSSSDNDETDPETDSGGKLIFLPDIEKHLRNNRRIPAHVLAGPHPPDPAAAWAAGKELVLYREPSSLSVPEEQDSVRKAILEARARAREKQRVEREQAAAAVAAAPPAAMVPVPVMTSSVSVADVPMDADPLLPSSGEEDPDAMEID